MIQIDLKALSADELIQLIVDAQAELAGRQTPSAKIRTAQAFDSYNQRRYGRPWIGRVTAWPVGGRPEIEFGRYAGDDNGGEAEIMAYPGDIIRWGQKDMRSNKTDNDWGILQTNGTIVDCTQTEARAAYKG